MIQRILGIAGVLIFVAAVVGAVYLLSTGGRAQARDRSDTRFGVMMSDVPPCAWDVRLAQRVLVEDNSQSIVINATDPSDVACQSSLKLLAPGFDISPRNDEQLVSAQPSGQSSVVWVVTPQKAGDYEIAVTDGINSRVFGVTVTNLLGLTAAQVQIVTTLGTLFGPMATLPWWIERWQQRKRLRAQTSPAAPATSQ